MSFNKNNPNAVGKIMGYLKQLSTEMGGNEQTKRRRGDEERLHKRRGPKYARVPSKPTLSASTTCTSLATSCGSQGTLAPHYAAILENVTTESSSEDEASFEKTRRHFQQLRQISLGNEFKYKMEMEIKTAKDENFRNSVPFVKQLSTDSNKVKTDYTINGDKQPYAPTTQRIYLWTQVFAAFAVSMGSLIVGFSSGYTSPTGKNMTADFQLSNEGCSWVGGLLPLAALVGSIVGGTLINYLGRRLAMTATAVSFFIGWMLMLIANANNVIMVYARRALCGICVGMGSLAFPVYLGETLQPEVRGTLGLLPTAFGNTGILLAYFVGKYRNWSNLAFLGAALPIPFFLLMLFVPETPCWYMNNGRMEDARKSLQFLRGKNVDIEKELKDLTRNQEESEHVRGNIIGQLSSKKYLPAIAIALGLMIFQQLSGINAIIFYAEEIFLMAGSSIDKNSSHIIIRIVYCISTFIAIALIDRLGRKMLLYISSVSMIITMVTLGAYCYLNDAGVDVKHLGWLPLACLVIYVLGFSVGFGPVPRLMLGEILPSKIRGTAASLATALNWTCAFIETKTFENVRIALKMYGVLWLFTVICIIGLLFVIFFVPETRGVSLEEIEKKLTGGSRRVRNIKNNDKTNQNGC